ncbi:MAG: lysylphosphatidylglycerol synthase transmembrane domain-containing protein [Candidatus Omnitrophota bacterium]
MKKILSFALRIGISIFLMVFLFRRMDKTSLLEIIKTVNMPLLCLGFVVFFANYLLCFIRWQMLLEAADINLSLSRIVMSYSGSVFFGLFLPSSIGGDMVRSIDLAVHTKKPHEVIATVFLDRLSGYVGLVILTLIALVFGWKLLADRTVLFSVAVISAVLIAVLLVLFNKSLYSLINRFLGTSSSNRIKESIRALQHQIYLFKGRKRVIVYNLLMSFVIQMISPVCLYFVALSLGININIMYFFVFLPIISAITLLPVSIGGLGLRETATIFFFAKVGVSKDLAFAMSLLSFSFLAIYGALGGLIYVLAIHHRRLQPDKSPAV